MVAMVRVAFMLLALAALVGCTNERRRLGGDTSLPPSDSAVVTDGDTPDATVDAPVDSGVADTSLPDTGTPDTAVTDTGVMDTSVADTGTPDTGVMDTGTPAITIEDVQRGLVMEGTTVTFTDVIVTGVYSQGIWVQDPTIRPTYSGIRVYEGATPTVSVGDRVEVTGTYIEYFGDTEIELGVVTRLGAGTPIVPVSVTVAMAASEAYEGVLVRITDASSYLSSYDCTVDNPACTDTDVWQVSSSLSDILVSDYVYESTDWLSHIGDLDITGVTSWRYDNRRIMPRSSSDFAP